MAFRLNTQIKQILFALILIPITGYTATVDQIVAIVNDHAITSSALNQRIATMKASRQPYGTKQDVLNQLIDESLLLQRATDAGVKVTQEQVLQQVERIAEQNHLNMNQLQQAVQQQGITWNEYLANMYRQMVVQSFQQGFVQQRVIVTKNDIQAFLKQYPTGIKPVKEWVSEATFVPKAVALQQIFLPLPAQPTPSDIAAVKHKIQQIYNALGRGESFAKVAQQYSAGPSAQQGGELGLRLNEQWPQVFLQAIQNVPDGGITQPIAAPNGVHILRVVERRGENVVHRRLVTEPPLPYLKLLKANKPVMLSEYDVQIIRITMNPVVTPAIAKDKIDQLYRLLQQGTPFAQVAKKYSDDPSAPIGGELGWVSQVDKPEPFMNQVAKLKDNQFSQPFLLGDSYVIVRRNTMRTQDISKQVRQNYAYQSLFDQRAKDTVHDFNTQLRAGAYIKYFAE